MKNKYLKIACIGALFAIPTGLSAQLNNNNLTKKEFKGADFVRAGQFSELPSYIRFKTEDQFDLSKLEAWMVSNMKFDNDMGFQLLKTDKDNLGHVHYRYQQTYKGYPIQDAIWLAHTNNNKVYAVNGLIYSQIVTPSSASLSENDALENAKSFVGATTYKWEIPAEEQHLKWESNDPEASYFPTAELVLVPSAENFNAKSYRLAYKFNIYAQAPLYRAHVFVDANSGEILRENLLIHHVDEIGNAHTGYSGERTITADSFDGEYRLRDGSRGDGVRTFDLNESTTFGSAVDFIDDDNDWDNANAELDEYATDAHFGAEKTYDYFFLIHGRNSLDNSGFQLNSYVHYSVDFFNAFWDGERMTYGDGNGGGSTPLTTIDIAGHEVSHGLTNFTANLVYEAESGALNESFSDIFGNAIERYARPDDWDWLVGAEIGTTLRSMSNPNAYGDPDTYFGDSWASLTGGDSGGVHTNSGVQNFWYYLLTEGGTGTNDNGDDYAVTGLGPDESSAIAFRNLTVYLTASSNFEDARFYAIQAATDLYGECSAQVEQTTNAWYAVGLGSPYSSEVNANFASTETTGCSVPFTVNFSNTSVNGESYLWNFGDGSTSTAENPSHEYTSEGTFTVTLEVDGEACGVAGEDDITEVDYVLIDTDLDCPVDFPTSGVGPIQQSCSGTLFDSGGPDGEYTAGEDASITIAPVDASTVTLSFTDFDIELADGCIYDFVDVHDGPDASAPLIGRYCGTFPPGDIESTGGAVTIQFHSDGFVQGGGFKVTWLCNIVDDSGIDEHSSSTSVDIFPNPSEGNITIDTKTITKGTIEVTDMIGKRILVLPFKSNLTTLDLSKYNAKGVYLVNIKDEKGQLSATEKVIIN